MKKYLLIITIASLLLGGCAPSKSLVGIGDECIPPLFDVAFPVMMQTPGAVTPRQIPPQGNWQSQDALPFPQDELSYLGSRPKQHELWFMIPKSHKVYRYFIDKKQWKSYEKIGTELTVPDRLFVASDGTVWGAGIQVTDNIDYKQPRPLFSRFNDATDQFEFVPDNSEFLQIPQIRLVSNIVEDQSGLLWFFIEGESKQILYSFDVKTQQAQQHYSMGTGGHNALGIGPDGSVWFMDVFTNQLIQYEPLSQETRIYQGTPGPADTLDPGELAFDLAGANYIYFDRSGRLWLANFGWLDFSNNNSPVWNRVIESPVFISEGRHPAIEYGYSYQSSMYQSSNGWYWFKGAGIVRLDLEQGSWCLMTTDSSDVVEDNDHNLWIAVFGHLYKYPLKR
jgi:streptogramin lyase